jgi:hypothetical protein
VHQFGPLAIFAIALTGALREQSDEIYSDPKRRPDPMNAATERRQSGRIATTSEVLVRRVGGFNFNVALKDISTGGCRLEMLEPTAVGDRVIARLPQLEPLGSCVKWAQGTINGVEFASRIHPAVFNLLLTRLTGGAIKD